MNKIEQQFTRFMEAVGGIICRIGALISTACRWHHRSRSD
jgi:hypothetical protein